MRENNAAIQIQRHVRGMLARKWCKTQLEHIVFLQSCIRRRVARKELMALKAEAKSANHFKEVSYKLENKVVELTQTVTTLKNEKKGLHTKVSHLETQIQHWTEKHEKMEKDAKAMEVKLREITVPQSDFDTLLAEKNKIASDHTAALDKITLLITDMDEIKVQVKAEKEKNESLLQKKESEASTNEEVADLKSQIVALKAQLAKAMHTRQQQASLPPTNHKSSRALSPSPNAARRQQLSKLDGQTTEEDSRQAAAAVLTNRKIRRNSSAEVTSNAPKTSIDQIRKAEALGSRNPRPTSVGQSNTIAGGKSSRIDEISDDPEEEVNRLSLSMREVR